MTASEALRAGLATIPDGGHDRRRIALDIALRAAGGHVMEADALIAEAKKIDAYLRGKEDGEHEIKTA